MHKICKDCNEEKSIDNFSPTRKPNSFAFGNPAKIIYSHYCKQCCNLRAKNWRKKHKEITGNSDYRGSGKHKDKSLEERTIRSAVSKRLTQAMANSRRNPEREFNISREYLYNLFIKQQGICAISGTKLSLDINTKDTLSIDKIIPELGYIEGNVQWTSWAVNRAKGDLSMLDFLQMCSDVLKHNKV